METSFRLLGQRRFLPLFITQFLGAFNDNMFKMAMIVLVTYQILADPGLEANFNALASALFILPFFLFSALAGQFADSLDKAWLIRLIKNAEIIIMLFGATGLMLHSIPLMLIALFAMGMHSTFFGPIKYAILPQHLDGDHVLGGTGLVEAGTYIAILLGTVAGGSLPTPWAAAGVVIMAVIGRFSGGFVPPAAAIVDGHAARIDFNVFRASYQQIRETMHIPRLFLAIMSISFFWGIAAVLAALFPPMVKNALGADKSVATIFMGLFSIGIALGSVAINRMLKGHVSARFSPGAVIVMGLFVLDLWWSVVHWPHHGATLLGWREFILIGKADRIMFDLLGIATTGGMFVVPLYAFLTTTVAPSETARTVAANNIVNSGAMVIAVLMMSALTSIGVTIADTILLVAAACIVSAWLAQKLHKACD